MEEQISQENMKLILHSPEGNGELATFYQRAFANATELFIVTAYLTEWDSTLVLNEDCRNFRVIIGKDFGITKKAACESVMKWLPARRKGQFLVADNIAGFHPKAVFWKEANGQCFSIVGSSNLTRAAFETNYEANLYCRLSAEDYSVGKNWVKKIEEQSVVVSEDWLKRYKEAPPSRGARRPGGSQITGSDEVSLVTFKLPKPAGMQKQIDTRRDQLLAYKKKQAGLKKLFRQCESGEITSKEFYEKLPQYWSSKAGNRFQDVGWERQGKSSDFKLLSQSYLRILAASKDDRDDVVVEEIDRLHELGVPTRGAFLSEMLCLRFPEEYPVLNDPVKEYLKSVKYKAPRGASEGARFIFLAKSLRASLLQNPEHPAKNLAELDSVIWLKYSKKK